MKQSVIIVLTMWSIGIIGGYLLEKMMPSSFSLKIIGKEEIFDNNYGILLKTIGIGMLSASFSTIPFVLTVGGIVGKSFVIITDNYGIAGLMKGFMPHAIIEMLSCFFALIIPLFMWQMILEVFIKKNNVAKKKTLKKSLVIIVVCFACMSVCSYCAAYIEYNISESFWRNIQSGWE